MRRTYITTTLLVSVVFALTACRIPVPSPPWVENGEIFTDEATTINVVLGEEFIIRYEIYNDAFPLIEVDDEPSGIVTLEDKEGGTDWNRIGHVVEWFLFKAVRVGETNVTIKETVHQESEVHNQKTFRVSVTSPSPPTIPNLRNLSEAEKEKAIQIALNTAEAREQLQKGLEYTATLAWFGIVWVDTHASEVWGLDYDAVEKGVPSNMPQSAVIYSRVDLLFGEPPELLIRVAVDIPTETAVYVDSHGLKRLPGQKTN